jgi:tetratricopeptide (TPR) repeat protein
MNAELQSLLRMLQTDPNNALLRSHFVRSAIAVGEYEHADQIVDTRLREVPTDPHALFDSATILMARKQYQDAILQLQSLLNSGQRHAGIFFNIGLCHYCLGEYAAAREPLQEAYELGERTPGLLRLLISSLHHLGLMDEAVALADAHSEAAHNDGPLAGVLALLYLDAEQAGPAARWARVALKFNPSSVDGLTVQATLHIAQMRTEEARREFDQILQLAPQAGRAWLGLGTLALLAQDLPRAKELFHTAVKYMGGHVGTLHMLAWTELAAGAYIGAQRAFEDALALNRNFAETHGGLAALAALRGDREAAQRSIEVAERLDSECLAAQLARALLASGSDPQLARRIILETAGTLASKDSSALSRLLGRLAAQS